MIDNPIQSSISSIDGESGSLRIRGYSILELAQKKQFEDVAYLLLKGELPREAEKRAFREALWRGLELDKIARFAVHAFQGNGKPPTSLRTFLSNLCCPKLLPKDFLQCGGFLIGRLAASTAGILRVSQGMPPLSPQDSPQPSGSFASQLHFLAFGSPPKQPEELALDRALSLHSENGLNASTFAVRIAASTGTDLVSALCVGLATLVGPRHGGASVQVVQMLQEIGTPSKVGTWLKEALSSKKRIPGFGHRIFRDEDPRALFLEKELESLARFRTEGSELAILKTLVQEFRKKKHLPRNIDLYAGPIFSSLGFPPDFFPCLFAIGRVPGWIAHFQEQESKGRLIRPLATYIGPPPRNLSNS
jgi:citrate synthase